MPEKTVSNLLLSIDGGGALGIGPCELLVRLEEGGELRPAAFAGTSVGALLVALAATGRSWGEIRDIFLRECPRIFERPGWRWRWNPWRPRYDGRALRAAAQQYCGDHLLSEVAVPIFLTSFDFHLGRPKVWDRGDAVPLWRAVVASAAAPTYFPIVDGRYGDGGLVANNPAMVGLAGCVAKEGWDLGRARCFSLGTNGNAWRAVQVRRRTLLGWVRPLLDTFMGGAEELADFEARALLGARLLRVEPRLRHGVALDDVEVALGPYRRRWGDLWEERKAEIVGWLRSVGNSADER